ncbi:MAG TPA: hypothetical protein VFZ44_05575 [Pyrinomonadaceae bacterium]
MSSNRQPEENENLLNSIASTVELMRDRMATKDDLERFATKDDLSRFATKEDLERFATKEDLERFATRDDFDSLREQVGLLGEQVGLLGEQVSFLGGQVEDVRDRMATKEELARVEERLTNKIEVETTAVRGDIEQVHLRLDGIDKSLSSRINHVEAEMSRMRSVLYLLVKDRPDMLRLLGQAPPAGG